MVITADGFTEGPEGEFDWPNVDEGFNEFAVSQIHDLGALLFGRVTYEGMASYWPTPQALEDDPVVTDLMNRVPKYVFSHTLSSADWANTPWSPARPARPWPSSGRDGYDLAVVGSAKFTASLIEQGLVDELRVMVNPVLLGGGVSAVLRHHPTGPAHSVAHDGVPVGKRAAGLPALEKGQSGEARRSPRPPVPSRRWLHSRACRRPVGC